MTNNDVFGFNLDESVPFPAYHKVVVHNVSVSIVPTQRFHSISVSFYSTDDINAKNEYMFSFLEGPNDNDVNNMFKFVNDYLIPYINNQCDKTGYILDKKRKEMFQNLRTTNCFHCD